MVPLGGEGRDRLCRRKGMGWGGEDEDHILFLDLGGGYFILFYF